MQIGFVALFFSFWRRAKRAAEAFRESVPVIQVDGWNSNERLPRAVHAAGLLGARTRRSIDLNANVHWLMLILFVGLGLRTSPSCSSASAPREHPKAIYHGTKSHFSTYARVRYRGRGNRPAGRSSPSRCGRAGPALPGTDQNPLEVRVVAEQFAWNVHYPGADDIFGKTDVKLVTLDQPLGLDLTDPHAKDDIVTLNQLHLQVNRPVIVRLTLERRHPQLLPARTCA